MLFVLSLVLLVASSYLTVSILNPRKGLPGVIYLFLVVFAQLVFISELLSIFNALYPIAFLGLQIVLSAVIFYFWRRIGRNIFKISLGRELKKVFRVLCKDKALLTLSVGFCFLILVSLFLSVIMGPTSGDAEVYHVSRAYEWVLNHSVNHFETSQVRMLAFPINSELLYTWIILFTKQAVGLGIFSFIGFISAMPCLYGLMGNFSINRRLWVIFILSSFSSVLVQASGTETDIIISALVLASMYLFKLGLAEKQNSPIFFAGLSYAFALGTKTTAFFLIPAVALFMLFQIRETKSGYRPFAKFLGFGVVNFLIFSAYNYILNFIWFGNFLGAYNTIEFHRNVFGVKGMIANFIKNLILFFDFTGFSWNTKIGEVIIPLRDSVLQFFALSGVTDGINSGDSNVLNNRLIEAEMGCGILGLLLFVPSVIYAVLKPIFKNSKNSALNLVYALMFVIAILAMSYSIVFMTFNNRFISTFIVVCAPLLGYTYFPKKFGFIKWCIVIVAMFYLTMVSVHIWNRPAIKILDAIFNQHQSMEDIRTREIWALYKRNLDVKPVEFGLANSIKSYPVGTKFVLFPSYAFRSYQILKIMLQDGVDVDFKLLETFDLSELDKYDVVIINVKGQATNVAYDFAGNIDKYKIENKTLSFIDENSPAKCVYFDKEKQIITSQDEAKPTNVHCTLDNSYLYQKGYRASAAVYEQQINPKVKPELEFILLKKLAMDK